METDFYLAADKRFNEPLDLRPVESADFLDVVSPLLDENWKIARKGVWINFHDRRSSLPLQGWKIHLSCVPLDARRLLEAVAAHLVGRGVSFKFLADAKTLRMTNAKSWTRGGSGKFITVYPADEAAFRTLLDELHELTRAFAGPYILSDKRYKDSTVLYYRYGGIRPNNRLQADGRRLAVLVAPDGREVEDARNPVYAIPDWVAEPFLEAPQAAGTGLNGGRYAVERALQFSNTGGVYVALDAVTGRKVILKEARARVHNFSDIDDAAVMLRREYGVLQAIEGLGVAPRPIELFEEWEHLFLAEEYLEGYVPLRNYSAASGVFLDTRPTRERVAAHLKKDFDLARKVAAIVDALHAKGVVWGDVSFNNILVHPETLDVKIIDLESAYRAGDERHARIITPGFADARAAAGAAPEIADDYYGVGSVLLFLVAHVNGLLGLKPRAWREMMAEMTNDFGLPLELTGLLEGLLNEDPALRPNPTAALAGADSWLARIGPVRFGADGDEGFPGADTEETVREGCRFIKENADLHRKDRLFPADPMVYQTNPLGLAHGAAGVLYALNRVEGSVEPRLVERLLKEEITAADYAPGMQNGLAGIAWTMLDLGRADEARAVLDKGAAHPLLGASSDLSHGLAGWGLANLRFWLATRDRVFLDRAEAAGKSLVETASERDGGLCWPDKDGVVKYGLAYGSSGIALFLLYLDRALGGGFEAAAVSAMEHDLSQGVETPDGGLSWRRDSENLKVVSPYLKQGSAGVGVAALRFLRATGEAKYRTVVDRIFVDCDRKYALFPGRNDGLSGIGEFLLDAFRETRDPKFLRGAHRIAAGLKVFRVRETEGSAFPGNGLSRLSCDLATGSAGVILFLDRLLRPRPADFLLDELLDGGAR
jgi:tRNA A-37 threonylcarbamoyl transferase component Bud32